MSRFKTIASKTIFRTILKSSAITVGILLAIAAIAVGFNWTFVRRLFTYPDNSITNVDWYEPKELVKGKPIELSTANPTFDRNSLEQITAYVQAADSSALLVMHQGNLVWERYWGEFDAASTSNSMSMSKTVLALLVGIASQRVAGS